MLKGDSEDPFYSLDLRHAQSVEAAKHWAHHSWTEKVKFHFEEVRSSGELVAGADSGSECWAAPCTALHCILHTGVYHLRNQIAILIYRETSVFSQILGEFRCLKFWRNENLCQNIHRYWLMAVLFSA